MSLLILNAGSSTLKVSLMDANGHRVPAWGSDGLAVLETTSEVDYGPAVGRLVETLPAFLRSAPEVGAVEMVVHRVVFGGTRFPQAALIDGAVRAALTEVAELAPLHNPPSLAAIDAAMAAFPAVPHVAVFDTGFHATLAEEAYTYPLPLDWRRRWGVRRFGFHGASHAYGAERAAAMLSRPAADLKVIVAHLGNGASVTAVDGGRSVDTTMGFTPLEGLMMGTRAGSVDPGALLYLVRHCGLSIEALEHALNHESGLLGVSGVSADMREVVRAADDGDARAALAVRVFVRRARAAIGGLAVTLGRVDALVFTAGIGEHSALVRSAICDGLQCLGLELDQELNVSARPDAVLSASASRGTIMVVTSKEDVILARAAVACVRSNIANKPAAGPSTP
jgi:acetate kinase